MAEKYKLQNVIFYGKRPLKDMPQFYSMADAMIVSLSKNDVISNTLPGKVQSYMCAGKPIIGCIDGETQIILKESNCGMYCDAEDSESLSKIFIEMASIDLQQYSNNAIEYYENNFTKKLFFERLIKELY